MVAEALHTLTPECTLSCHLSAEEAVPEVVANPPEVLLTEVDLPGVSGFECTRKLHLIMPELQIIIFTDRTSAESVLTSVMSGATGYLVKPHSARPLVPVLKDIFSGRHAFCEEAVHAMMNCLQGAGAALQASLTSRERDILVSLVVRRSDKEIAELFGISHGTVHRHVTNIFKKLGVHNRREVLHHLIRTHRQER